MIGKIAPVPSPDPWANALAAPKPPPQTKPEPPKSKPAYDDSKDAYDSSWDKNDKRTNDSVRAYNIYYKCIVECWELVKKAISRRDLNVMKQEVLLLQQKHEELKEKFFDWRGIDPSIRSHWAFDKLNESIVDCWWQIEDLVKRFDTDSGMSTFGKEIARRYLKAYKEKLLEGVQHFSTRVYHNSSD